jgi:hypothetical protein
MILICKENKIKIECFAKIGVKWTPVNVKSKKLFKDNEFRYLTATEKQNSIQFCKDLPRDFSYPSVCALGSNGPQRVFFCCSAGIPLKNVFYKQKR